MNSNGTDMETRRGAFTISTDPSRLDLDVIHGYLVSSYWAKGIPREIAERSLRHSLNFGLYDGDKQIGLARVITDRAVFAYVCDVFVLEAYRGRGLAVWLMETIRAHPELQNLRRWLLMTKDAHGLYRKSGFREPEYPTRLMEIVDRKVYERR
jgi:GNAT superfamily N-acetyltransferase